MNTEKNNTLLSIKDLKVNFTIRKNWFGKAVQIRAVDGVNLNIGKNEILGLVGESGSGKTSIGRSLLKLVEAAGGEINFEGRDILRLKENEMFAIRRKMQMIFQDSYASLSPRMQIRQIISEPLLLHKMVLAKDVEDRVSELLQEVGLESYFKDRYPHEMSGGQRQRISIARALALKPDLIIADESVSALDVSVTAQILNLMKKIQREKGMSMLFISHDLNVVGHMADRIAVMYAGTIVEEAATHELITNPLHPYTKLLISSVPGYHNRKSKNNIQDQDKPVFALASEGMCPFVNRCPEAMGICRERRPPLKEDKKNIFVACWKYR
jgi:oligopeptide/dipeptide ABC transporter ATP-binding protein